MIINQPFIDALGFKLIDRLRSDVYSNFYFIVAYAKTSGVNRLLPYMQQFKATGGKIFGIIGIDQNNTSYEALVSLYGICDELYVYHSEGLMRTFHVKAYYFKGNRSSWIAIGSNNFTAGGLFSNYEASIYHEIENSQDNEFLNMFDCYSNTDSPCCKLVNLPLIKQLLRNGYIRREKVLAKQRITKTRRQRNRQPETILFGREVSVVLPQSTVNITTVNEQTVDDMNYLIRHVPRAGGRSKQVHFTMDILQNYFNMEPGEHLYLQQIDDIYTPHTIEERKIVLSGRNRNVKIEVAAADILNKNYPADENKRPILVFKRVNPRMFEYMLLIEGDPGYDALNSRLLGLSWHQRSLRYEIINTDTMLTIWEDCPLI